MTTFLQDSSGELLELAVELFVVLLIAAMISEAPNDVLDRVINDM